MDDLTLVDALSTTNLETALDDFSKNIT